MVLPGGHGRKVLLVVVLMLQPMVVHVSTIVLSAIPIFSTKTWGLSINMVVSLVVGDIFSHVMVASPSKFARKTILFSRKIFFNSSELPEFRSMVWFVGPDI
jgi:hypothetical protein